MGVERSALEQADEILTWMSRAIPKSNAVPLSFFDEAEPMTFEYMTALEDHGHLTDILALDNVTPRDVDNTFDVATIGGVRRMTYDEDVDMNREPDPKYKFSLARMRTMPARQCRGAARVYPLMAETTIAIIGTDAAARSNKLLAGWNGGRWVYAGPKTDSPHILVPAVQRPAHGCKLQFVRRYQWRVCLGYEGMPSVSFITDPVGAREVFRLRDIPNGQQRRAALLHWVSEHWRKRRTGDETSVRAHLRGSTSFRWNGLSCRVVPSPYDIEKSGPAAGKARAALDSKAKREAV